MKKVLFTATVDSHILQFHLPFLKLFKENGYEVHVATNGTEKIPYCDVKHTISFERSPLKLNNLKAIKQLRKIINEEKFDIIHTHTPMGSVVTRLAAKQARTKFGTRVIYTAHGFHFYKGASLKNWLLFYPVEKWLAKYTDTLILINDEDFSLAKRKFSKRCKDIQYVPGVGIDENKFNFSMAEREIIELRKTFNIEKNDFVMIYPAELSKRKRQVWLIDTLSSFMKLHKNVHLLLPGKDSLNGKCQKMVDSLNLNNQIHFLGYRNDIPKLLKISNIAVSSANQEGLPVNIMEAMYVGLPIIASNCRGNRDLVKDGENGYLIQLDDKKRFLNCVEKLYIDNNNNFRVESKSIIKEYLLNQILSFIKTIYNFNNDANVQKIAIITSGFLPVPASKGGAAENLLDTIIIQNEEYKRIKPVIFSIYDDDALKLSKKYKNSYFIFINSSFISKIIDSIIYFIIDKIFKKSNSRKYRYIFQRFDFFKKCSEELKKSNYDKVLLENHTIMYLSLKWGKNYLKYSNNYYYHCHNIVPSKYGMDKIIRNTRKFISVSKFRNKFVKDYFKVSDDQCSVVLNCCSSDIYRKIGEDEKIHLKNKYNIKREKIIMYVGRIDQDKGTLELIKAVNSLKNGNYKLIIVGAPIFDTGITTEYENIVKKEISSNNRIIMTGYVKHDELYKFYSIADLVVIPSQIDDSAPLVLIEALSSGIPIIASNCGGIPEYVNKKCALLIDRNENYVENLANAINNVLFDETLLKKMGEESLVQSQNYSSKKYYNDFVDALLS